MLEQLNIFSVPSNKSNITELASRSRKRFFGIDKEHQPPPPPPPLPPLPPNDTLSRQANWSALHS